MENNTQAQVCCDVKDRGGEKRLSVENLSVYYGEAQALGEVSITVNHNEVVAILGSNGAGKTTMLKAITGLLTPRSGRIVYEGEPITGKPAHQVINRGIASVPEGRELFGSMTVWDNLLMGTYSLSSKERKAVLGNRLEIVYTLFPILRERSKQKAENMSGGQQQMVAVGRALMADPRLLVLDEPSLGLSPLLVAEMMRALKRICTEWGVSLLLVEQNARAAIKIADYVYVLDRGKVVLAGMCQEVMLSPTIKKAYLGG